MIVLVSFPKSGRTWLRVMLDKLNVKYEYDHGKTTEDMEFFFHEVKMNEDKLRKTRCIYMKRIT